MPATPIQEDVKNEMVCLCDYVKKNSHMETLVKQRHVRGALKLFK